MFSSPSEKQFRSWDLLVESITKREQKENDELSTPLGLHIEADANLLDSREASIWRRSKMRVGRWRRWFPKIFCCPFLTLMMTNVIRHFAELRNKPNALFSWTKVWKFVKGWAENINLVNNALSPDTSSQEISHHNESDSSCRWILRLRCLLIFQ